MKRFICVTALATLIPATSLLAQHGVIREYAALAPRPDAVALQPLFDAPLTDASVCAGPDGSYYLTGSSVLDGVTVPATKVDIWRSTDLRGWRKLRTLDFGTARFLAPEIHWLQGTFWLTLGHAGGGTELVRFETADLAASGFARKQITTQGADPSLFLDEDDRFHWVMGGGEIAPMKASPLDGLVAEPRTIPVRVAGGDSQQAVVHRRGAHLAKIEGKYHLFVTGRLMRGGLGRTGLAEGVDDVLVAASEKPDSGYSDFYVAFPNAGQTTLFRDLAGNLWATFSGADPRAIPAGRPGAFRVEQVPATEPRWPIGFNGLEKPQRFPFGLMLRPDTSLIYERGMGFTRAVPLDQVPGQRADVPWIRDTFIMVGRDGNYYLTGTSGNMDGINLWKSADLKHLEFVRQVWTPEGDPSRWYNNVPNRLFWAPELHYINGTYWIAFCINAGKLGKNGLLKSTSGRAEGPYELAFPENRGVDERIDASLFQDTDGSVYYVWQDGMIRKLNPAMNGFDGAVQKIVPIDGQRVGYEGATLVKIGSWYVLTAAEWNGGSNRADGTYDMMYSCSKSLLGPYQPRRVAVPHAGHGALFRDKSGRWNAALFGNDRTAPFRAMPGFVPVETSDTGDDLLIRPAQGEPETAQGPVIRRGDWIVTGVETVQGQHILLNGNLILEPNAVLTLEDCRLEIVGTRSREHLVDWRGGRLVTRRSTLGGFVQEDGTPIHTVFHLYQGEWEAMDTTVQYSYGISFHWQEGRGVLKGTRLRAGLRPDAIICSGRADITLIDSDFPIGLGVYVQKGGRTGLDLPTGKPLTAVYDSKNLTPGVEWRLDLKNTTVGTWFLFLRNIGMESPPCEVTLGESTRLIVSLLGHNLTGDLNLSNDLAEPVKLGNLTLRRADEFPGVSTWALYCSGDKTDLKVRGATHICELMHSGGRLHLAGTAGRSDLSIGCTTLELSGSAALTLEHVHLGQRSAKAKDAVIGEVNVVENATLTGTDVSVRGVRFHTRDQGRIAISGLEEKGKIEIRQEGGAIELKPTSNQTGSAPKQV